MRPRSPARGLWNLLGWTAAGLLPAACGSRGEDDAQVVEAFESSRDSAATFAELEESELRLLCEEAIGYQVAELTTAGYWEAFCTAPFIYLTESQAECEAKRLTCLEIHETDPCASFKSQASCPATVADLESCLSAQLPLVMNARSSFACSAVEDPALASNTFAATLIPECRTLLVGCPGLVIGAMSVPET